MEKEIEMKKSMFFMFPRLARVLAGAALAAVAVGQVDAAPAREQAATEAGAMDEGMLSETSEPGTIPAARPGLPKMLRGAQGPMRSGDEGQRQVSTDPAIRDTNPLTVNGLWETMPGNSIVRPGQRQ